MIMFILILISILKSPDKEMYYAFRVPTYALICDIIFIEALLIGLALK